MNSAPATPARRLIGSAILTTFGFCGLLATPVVMSGCGDEKGQMTKVENPSDPAKEAQDSMKYYQQTKNKGGISRQGR